MTKIPSNPAKTLDTESTADPLYKFVREACSLSANRFGPEFFDEHLLVVERYALQLAELFGADREIVRTASLLHDMAAIQDFTCLPHHAERGAEKIAFFLSSIGSAGGFGLDAEHVCRIADCVREHSSPRNPAETTKESVCVSHADAMSQITRPFYWFQYARALRCLTYSNAIEWYRSLVCHDWSSLLEEAKLLIEKEYRAVDIMIRSK